MHVELWQITEDPEILIARCARVSRGKNEAISLGEARELIRKLITLGHESVLEHAFATFYVSGISRVCMAQITRHRLASFTVESQRSVQPKGELIVPASVKGAQDERLKELIGIYLDNARLIYDVLVLSGVPKEDARYFLPQAVTTSLVVSANFREWRHILRLRTAPEAQWEIRELCAKIGNILLEKAPSVFEDIMKEVK
jgi:thymidylate synthase (FAD)